MAALPRPDLPVGPHRQLNDALHELHHRAGCPSLSALAGEAGCSRTSVSAVFSSDRVPTWSVLELIVEAMDGDIDRFHHLWRTASPPSGDSLRPTPRIAGRREELAVVRRHLQSGTGLLLVTGEAGIGKSKLVLTAAATVEPETVVVTGVGLPISIDVPLLPIADLLRSVYEIDEQWFKEALAECAAYVPGSLSRLLPELEAPQAVPDADDGSARTWLFGAVTSVFTALGELRPLALLLEDLHWADDSTLDLLDHLLVTGRLSGVPLVGTFRTGDPDTSTAWLGRARRLPNVSTLALGPLSRDETGQQLAQLAGRPPEQQLVDRVHDRALGHPLFVEQLAARAGDASLPTSLADLLDQRLEGLSGPAWAVSRALGIADRALEVDQLQDVTGCPPDAVVQGIRELDSKRLLARTEHEVRLRHPLLAQAVRRRMNVAETVDEHRRMATALAAWPPAPAAVVAAHWKGARDESQELEWRVRSADEAAARFASDQEADEWRRVLELWSDDDRVSKPPGVSLCQVYCRAMVAVEASGDLRLAATIADDAMRRLDDVVGAERADLLRQVGRLRAITDVPAALSILDDVLALYEELPPSKGHVEALFEKAGLLRRLGHRDASAAVIARTVDVSLRTGDIALLRKALTMHAWEEVAAGRVTQGVRCIESAAALVLEPAEPDPMGDLLLAVNHTDIVLLTGRSAEAAVAAGQVGLDSARKWDIDSHITATLRANIARAFLRSGRVHQAGGLIMPVTHAGPTPDRATLYSVRAHIELLGGHVDVAADGYRQLLELPSSSLAARLELAERASICDVWRNGAPTALERLLPVLDEVLPTELSMTAGAALCTAVRAAADLSRGNDQVRLQLRARLQDLRASALLDPFGPYDAPADASAYGAMWVAELGRLEGTATTKAWARAATAWDKIGRPHDSAYCRWRAAQLAIATGEAEKAAKLLKRAARDAREHVPLLAAIKETTA